MKSASLALMSLGALVLVSICGGCVIGVKPASDTILHLSRISSSGEPVQSTFGFEYVYFDSLQNGYGVISSSDHPRDHETYLYFIDDKYRNSPYTNRSGYRRLLITPLGKRSPDRPALYRLELYLPDSLLHPGLEEPGDYHWFTGTIGPPSAANESEVRFNLQSVLMTSHDPRPTNFRLRGTIVAKKDSPDQFEYRLKDWNTTLWQKEWQNAHP